MKTNTRIISSCGKFILSAELLFGVEYINAELKFIDVTDGETLGTWTNTEVLINDVYEALLNGDQIEDDDCIINLDDYPTLIQIFDQAIKLGFFVTY
jgi:hypothetical protein